MIKKLFILLVIFFNFQIVFAEKKIQTIYEGNLDAKVKIIVFESLTCGACGNFHKNVYPDLKKDFIDKGLVKIEFKSFPLDMLALNASKIAHCKNDGKSKILHLLYKNQKKWVKGKTIDDANDNIKKIIENNGFKLDINKCLNNKEIEDYILEDRVEGVKKFKIEATPTLIINDKKFDNPHNYKKLKKTIEKLI